MPAEAIVVDLTSSRRATVSAKTTGAVVQFSRSLYAPMGSALVETVDTVGKSEIASTVDDEESAPIVDDTMETNLTAYLQAVSAGDERPMSSHPMRLAKSLVLSSLRDKQYEFERAGEVLKAATDLMKQWRDFIIYLATLVASVFEPMRFDACLQEICAFTADGTPDETRWRRALNYYTSR